jgi:hypothetical protein
MTGHEQGVVMGRRLQRAALVLWLAVVVGAQPARAVERPRLGPVVFNTVTAAISERVECRIGVDQAFENPYDPACVRLDAVIEGPAGTRVYPCFYRVAVTEAGTEAAAGEWVFRQAFRQEGVYRVSFRLTCAAGVAVTPSQKVAVAGRRPGGFIRADPQHNGVWLRDDGSRLFASGLNLAWSGGADRAPYREMLTRCAASGIRFIRVWMIGFAAQELEWSGELWAPWNTGYGLGRYNQRVAAFFDWLFEESARRGVFVQLVFETHGEWSTEVDANWEFNPYNAAHGGFLDTPAELFSNAEARKRAQARYRYCVARWGAESALAAWELFNEADQSDAIRRLGDEAAVVAWHQNHARFIQTLDAVPRPVVSSASDTAFLRRLAKGAPALDRMDMHLYRDDAVRAAAEIQQAWRETDGIAAGLYCGEFGVTGETQAEPDDPARVRGLVRRMTWRGRLTGMPAWYWFWNKAESAGVYDVHRAVETVFADWDLTAVRPMTAHVFGGPPAERLTLTPEWGWATTATNAHPVAVEGLPHRVLYGQSGFLQGAWKSEMGRVLCLKADFMDDGAFRIAVTGTSSAGANELTVRLDGREIWRGMVKAMTVLPVAVGRGPHTIELRNTGQDWLRIGSVTIVRPTEQAAEAAAVTDGRRAVAYVASRRFLAGRQEAAGPGAGLTLRLEGWQGIAATPPVRLVNPGDGADLGTAKGVMREASTLSISLPTFTHDIVVVVD